MDFQAKARDCSLTVMFTSIGTGTDGVTGKRIHELLEAEPAVVSVQPYLRGREGETELCVRIRDGASEIDRVFARLKALVPAISGGKRVAIRTRTGRSFAN